ncbi:hypothetical protein [Myceligenerans crystallogenes]|uniref:Rhamnogalacturonan lyase n=1 Tax=Myceligenerans crystallogenes TaxID=316335 RepID=A0ABP4ZUH4_9MICO
MRTRRRSLTALIAATAVAVPLGVIAVGSATAAVPGDDTGVYRFDLGGASDPVESGWTGVNLTTLHASNGYGITSTGQITRDRGTPAGVARDWIGYGEDWYFRVDLPAGTYDVKLTVAEGGGSAETDFVTESTGSRRLTASGSTVATTTYDDLQVTDGRLDILVGGRTNILNAVEITRQGGGSTPTPTPSSPGTGRAAEDLDRAPVAVPVSGGVYVGWRFLGNDPSGIQFKVYRGSTAVATVTGATNYLDAGGSSSSSYRIAQVVDGVESWATPSFTPWASGGSKDIPLQKPSGGTTPDGVSYTYSANDVAVGDLNGDGVLEYVVKWDPSNAKDNSQSGYTGNVYLDAYKLDGTRLWRIDLGRNIRAGAHYTQLVVFDLNSDGYAEVMAKTADGTRSGTGQVIGSSTADHRNSGGYILSGPEFLTVFDGRTGAAIDTENYSPGRGTVSNWGDSYGNRVDRFLAGVAYLDGSRPSAIFARGYYTRSTVAAWDFDGTNLTRRWLFDSDVSGSQYAGQGNHQFSVADVDADGRDEIVYGSMTLDDTGSPLYTTRLGHGDALHVGDLNPGRAGLEVFAVHECMSCSGNRGSTFRDARTGAVIWSTSAGADTGRGAAADIDGRTVGAEAWDSTTSDVHSVSGATVSGSAPVANFVTWWDGDLLREIADGGTPFVGKWNPSSSSLTTLRTFSGTLTNNGTKRNPAIQADLFGDWREELVYRTTSSDALRIFTTTDVTSHRLRTLLSDPAYRVQVAGQNMAYNQPPHTSYYLGQGMSTPPAPSIRVVEAPND